MWLLRKYESPCKILFHNPNEAQLNIFKESWKKKLVCESSGGHNHTQKHIYIRHYIMLFKAIYTVKFRISARSLVKQGDDSQALDETNRIFFSYSSAHLFIYPKVSLEGFKT